MKKWYPRAIYYVRGNLIAYIDPLGMSPVAGAIEGAEIGSAVFPGVGTVVGGLVRAGVGWWIVDKIGNAINQVTTPTTGEPDSTYVNPGREREKIWS